MNEQEYRHSSKDKREDSAMSLSLHIWQAHHWVGSLPTAGDRIVLMHAALHAALTEDHPGLQL